ncbi:inositol monophosphatase family protein [Vibrio diabolicus]|uniref:inositol monophosphatase family protein n=1 Tax=Vibrio diabolicus TaxID=50719 RepID=UPI001594CF37|nr:inositol monophosphatase family protein [Vibrio diabolicus]NVC50466.1 hypothetical protein [Vibrio diabolicus]
MDWQGFLRAFSSQFWAETALQATPETLELINRTDGTTNIDRLMSDRMIAGIHTWFGRETPILSEEEANPDWYGTGFVIDPIDGSWNFLFGYPAYCRIVSYLEQGQCRFFSIFNELEQQSICCNGEQLIHQGREICLLDVENPMVAVMFNTHYSSEKKRALLNTLEQLVTQGMNIRMSGSPGFDLYSLLTGAVGGVINLSPHQYDAAPILNCLRHSPLFEIEDLQVHKDSVGQFIRRRELPNTMRI